MTTSKPVTAEQRQEIFGGTAMTQELSKEQIQSLDTSQLRSLLRSTNPNSERFSLQIVWARNEMDRRHKPRNRNI